MHLAGMSATPYGPQLPCCANAEAAAASALVGGSGPACDPNCVTPAGAQDQSILDRMQAALDSLLHGQPTATPATTGQWFSGVSNSLVIAVGVGLTAVLLIGRRR